MTIEDDCPSCGGELWVELKCKEIKAKKPKDCPFRYTKMSYDVDVEFCTLQNEINDFGFSEQGRCNCSDEDWLDEECPLLNAIDGVFVQVDRETF